MKKIILSSIAALSLGSAVAAASGVTFYEDANGQLFTKPAEGRTLVKDVNVQSHASKLKFSGLTYIGYTFNDFKSGTTSTGGSYRSDTSDFEIRRAYIQMKAYLLENPKSYYRVTFDAHRDAGQTVNSNNLDGDMKVRFKYAYLYLDSVLPFTGVEIGLAHRPWHDYEEHNAWYFRNISKVLVEQKNGADLSNSADYGFMFKTKTQYLDIDAGVFNGEGYHASTINLGGKGLSFEWRVTAHLLGTKGKDKQDKVTYWDASFFGQYNVEHKADSAAPSGYDDLVFGGIHTVYNQPSFLVAAQYVHSADTAENSSYVSAQAGTGYSANAEYRIGEKKQYRFLGRYDNWTQKKLPKNTAALKTYIAGFAWDMNKNVEWVANVTVTDNDAGSSRENFNGVAYMLTTQVSF